VKYLFPPSSELRVELVEMFYAKSTFFLDFCSGYLNPFLDSDLIFGTTAIPRQLIRKVEFGFLNASDTDWDYFSPNYQGEVGQAFEIEETIVPLDCILARQR
jgi:hypothetical protein